MTDPQQTPPPQSSERLRQILAGVLVLALVASIVWFAIALVANYQHGKSVDEFEAAQGERDDVTLVTRNWVKAALNYDKSDVDGKKMSDEFAGDVSKLLTTSFRTEFEDSLTALAELISTQGFTRVTTVEHAGVESLDDDSASVIIGGLVSGKEQGKAVQPAPYALLVNLEKVKGKWLISDFSGGGSDQP